MRIAENDIFKGLLILSLGFYLSIIGFGENLLTGGGGGIESSKSGSIVNQITGLSLLGICGILVWKSRRLSIKNLIKIGWPIWILITYFILSLQWSYAPAISLRRVVALSTMVVTCLLLVRLFEPVSLLRILSNAIVLTVILGLVYSIVVGANISIGLTDRASGFRGIFNDKNAAARIYSYGVLLFVGLGRYKTKFDIFCLLLLVFAVAASQSATAVVMSVFGSGLIILFKMFKGKNIQNNLLRFVLLIVVLCIGSYIVNIAYEYILGLLGRDPSLTNRSIIWSLIDPLIDNEYLLGYGYGAFWVSEGAVPFIERWGFIGNAHSGYKEIMLHGGIIGTCILLFILGYQISKAIRVYISPYHSELSSFLLMMVLMQTVVNYIAYIIINHNSVDMFLYLICFFMICYQSQQSGRER
uniref:O-antigen ligase family protein n=1 Tax=Ningiella ruwaisensis TaxID=2364274 RepID=UPI0010A02AF8|nr:O-antigen ligase family protein [Ningiella ruwaisensis]